MRLNDEPADRLRAVFEAHDLAGMLALMDEHVVWRGLDLPRQATALCHDRAEVAEVYRSAIARGRDGEPVILRVAGDSVVVDPRPVPAREDVALHQVFTFRGSSIVLIQDFPDRASALSAVEAIPE